MQTSNHLALHRWYHCQSCRVASWPFAGRILWSQATPFIPERCLYYSPMSKKVNTRGRFFFDFFSTADDGSLKEKPVTLNPPILRVAKKRKFPLVRLRLRRVNPAHRREATRRRGMAHSHASSAQLPFHADQFAGFVQNTPASSMIDAGNTRKTREKLSHIHKFALHSQKLVRRLDLHRRIVYNTGKSEACARFLRAPLQNKYRSDYPWPVSLLSVKSCSV